MTCQVDASLSTQRIARTPRSPAAVSRYRGRGNLDPELPDEHATPNLTWRAGSARPVSLGFVQSHFTDSM